MITNINSFKIMEQFFNINTGWLIANIGALYIGLRARLLIVQEQVFGVQIDTIKNIALVLGIFSSIVYIAYLITKIYNQIIETKIRKKEHNIKKLFKFEEEIKTKE